MAESQLHALRPTVELATSCRNNALELSGGGDTTPEPRLHHRAMSQRGPPVRFSERLGGLPIF